MDLRSLDAGELTLAAQLDRLVAESLDARRHRLVFVEKVPDAAFSLWARAKATREPDDVAYLDLQGDGQSLVTGCIVGLDVSGDDLDEALNVVLNGRSVVLVSGLDRSRARLGERLFRWLDWSATHLPLTVATTREAAAYVVRLRHHNVAVVQILDSRLSADAAALAGRAIQSRQDP
ncbi:hypothetical protein GPA22_01115 [Aromatoleum toluvorans]|uniref:Uncharacterized protein n=1 Tax=Aromatoleum toluvorans TaxID=92002 RepID=A0ABX1PUH2_9RHOO|nr:hypothetical protein [Aromatoleum toluvorans]NMG42337.1 hypothetical protein [Aromatoleum toluvorans]